MAKKELTVSIGGEQRVLQLSKMGFLKCLQDYTGKDPLKAEVKSEVSFGDTFSFLCGLVYAGLLGKHPKEEVEGWVGDLEADDAAKIVSDYNALMVAPGEAIAPEVKP